MLETYRGFVHMWECNHTGHFSVIGYATVFDAANWNLQSQIGLSRTDLETAGLLVATANETTSFERELFAGDTIAVRSTVTVVGSTSFNARHELFLTPGDEPAATQNLTQVMLSTETRRPAPLPDSFSKDS